MTVKAFDDNVSDTHYLLDTPRSLPTRDPQLNNHVIDLFNLKGKVAVVTGGGQGIGYAICEAYAQAGAEVAIWDISDTSTVATKLEKLYGVKLHSYVCDVTDSKRVEQTVNNIVEDFGDIDIFVANAGINIPVGTIINEENSNDKNWLKVMDINLNGVYYCAKNVGKVFSRKPEGRKGSMIITGSMSGHIINTPVHQAAYNASKASVIHFAKSLAIEFVDFARVNSISPGYVNSGINDHLPSNTRKRWWSTIPMGREGLPRELVGAYLYLASDASTYTTAADIIVDGGWCAV